MEKKILEQKEVIHYDPSQETIIDGMVAKPNDKIVPLIALTEGNMHSAGYIPEDNRFIIQFQGMRKSVEGFELGIHPEPFMYVYDGVDSSYWDGFLKAKNKVKFFETYIKDNFIYHREEILNSF